MEKNNRGIVQNCGCELARPYVNDQVLTKMYNLSTALQTDSTTNNINIPFINFFFSIAPTP